MLKTPWVGIALAAAVMAGPACKKKDETKPTEKVVSNEKKEAPPPAKPVGLADPTNDPKVVEAAKKVLADCAKTMDEPSSNHKELKTELSRCDKWGDDFGNQKFEKADATFVNFLDDPDVRVRAIGLEGLHRAYDWRKDKALVTRVLEGLKKEKAPSPIDHQWVQRIDSLDSDLGVDDQIKAIAMDANASKDVKNSLLMLWKGPAHYEVVKANAAATDPETVKAVIIGYGQDFRDHTEEACAYWEAHFATPDESVNQMAIGQLTGGTLTYETRDTETDDPIGGDTEGPHERHEKRCSEAQLTKALDVIEKAFADKKEGDWMERGLAFIAADKLSPKPLKERAIKDLKAMVERKNYFPGHAALRDLVAADPANVKYAQKFAKDPDLADTVKDINEAEKQKKADAKKAKK